MGSQRVGHDFLFHCCVEKGERRSGWEYKAALVHCRGSVEEAETGDKKRDHEREKGVHYKRTPVRMFFQLYRRHMDVHRQKYKELGHQILVMINRLVDFKLVLDFKF